MFTTKHFRTGCNKETLWQEGKIENNPRIRLQNVAPISNKHLKAAFT